MAKMPKIIQRCELPIGTLVKVLKYHEANPFQAMVRGYDLHHSKFEVGYHFHDDRYSDGGMWVFPQEIAGYKLPNDDEWWRPDPMPEPPPPMPWGEYTDLVGQPVEGRWTHVPDHIYGEPEERVVRGILCYPEDGGLHQIQHFYGHMWETFPWEHVRALSYDELTTQDVRDWFGNDPKAAMRFAFQAFAGWSDAEFERREDARQAATDDMRH